MIWNRVAAGPVMQRAPGRSTLASLALAVLALAGLIWMIPSGAGASDSVSTSAAVKVLDPITVKEVANLEFGLIYPPQVAADTFEVTTENVSRKGGGDGIWIGGHHRGEYRVIGTVSEEFTLLSAAVKDGCSDPQNLLLLTQLSTLAIPPGSLNATIYIGGTLQVQPGIAPGRYTCSYIVGAQYR